MTTTLHTGDCLDVLREMPDDSVDSIVTDPPYGLSFMGKAWDKGVPGVQVWTEAIRVLKPGGHLLAFAGTRTQHRMAVAIEDAGFEIRDMIAWVYGSGFPKSHDVAKSIDARALHGGSSPSHVKKAIADRPGGARATATLPNNGIKSGNRMGGVTNDHAATDAARQWDGWGTALKPALEPITVARKPLAKGNTVAANVLEYGTGSINVDGCRVEGRPPSVPQPVFNSPTGRTYGMKTGEGRNGEMSQSQGRFPANLIHDGSDEVTGLFPVSKTGKAASHSTKGMWGSGSDTSYQDSDPGGSAARFFYCAKASKADRNDGLPEGATSNHPTVKPTDLMRYLCRLVTPPGGIVLDPFMGSGSTGRGAVLEGFGFIGIDAESEYVNVARARIEAAQPKPTPTQERFDI